MANANPKPGTKIRIPIYRAPFYFSPRYLRNATEWQQTFRDLAEGIILQHGCDGRVVAIEGYSLKVAWGDIELMIDARVGKFDISERDDNEADDIFTDSWAGFETEPAVFVERLRAVTLPDRWRNALLYHVAPFAEVLLRQATWRFEEALRKGLAEIQVQALSPLPTNPYTILHMAQRKYFSISPKDRSEFSYASADDLDEAKGPNGEILYSVGVKAVDASPPLTQLIDGRRKHDWDLVETVILKEYQAIKLHPKRSRAGLKRRVEAELGARAPGSTELTARIKKIIPTF